MGELVMDVRPKKRGFQPKFRLDKGLSDALADYARRRWPSGTAKSAARAWDLTVDEGQGLVKGRASKTTVEKCFKHGGLLLALQVLEEVTGERLADILNDIRGLHDESVYRLGAAVRRPGADPAAGGLDGAAGRGRLPELPAGRRRRHG